ncbi:AT-hook motif nuclear-localized protein 17-like [Zingiber officinale]|uniref:AT-hook motif nuclear-localized protein 17-like n=1 Tax=Zingiber officinale TaxID=94328 RepID=UPI001C4C4ADD|nr:AT-hook motif nuclear-localized protein 17-like [Zingiber officinale]
MFFDNFLEKKMMQSSKQGEEVMLRVHFQQLQHGNQYYERPAEYSVCEDSSRFTRGEIRKHYKLEGEQDGAGEKRILAAGDGATIEVAKRRRGRPPGSKNKPKPADFAEDTAQPPSAAASSGMGCHVLEIPSGGDVVDSLERFARQRGLGVCVLGASGAVSNVALLQPPDATVAFRGRFEILSMSATVLPPAMAALGSTRTTVSVSMAAPGGHVMGGTVAGPLTAAGTVVVVTAGFANPTFHQLPAEDDVSVSVSVSGGSDETEENKHQSKHRMPIYSGHVSPDVVWPTASRPPLPPPY